MKRLPLVVSILVILNSATAQQLDTATVRIERPWTRALPPKSTTAAVYLTVTNEGPSPERLLSVSTPNATHTEIHTHTHDNGIMRMRPVEAGIALAPMQRTVFAPGGLHLMLFGLKGRYRPGNRFPITLHFERGQDKTVEVEVVRASGP